MTSIEKKLKFQTPRVASQLYCGKPELLKEVEKQLSVDIVARENWIQITGPEASVKQSETFFDFLDQARAQGMDIRKSDFDAVLQQVINGRTKALETLIKDPLVLKFPKRKIIPKTLNQKRYLEAIFKKEVVFGIGPAGYR